MALVHLRTADDAIGKTEGSRRIEHQIGFGPGIKETERAGDIPEACERRVVSQVDIAAMSSTASTRVQGQSGTSPCADRADLVSESKPPWSPGNIESGIEPVTV